MRKPWTRSTAAAVAAITVISALFSQAAAQTPSASPGDNEVRATDAVEGLAAKLDTYSAIALPEVHGLKEGGEFIAQLLQDPDFAAKVDDIVVEFGNPRYQKLIDRFVNGEDVPRKRLAQVWRDTTAPGTWDAPIYELIYKAARAVNQVLPERNHVRIVAADMPIDWSTIKTQEDYFKAADGKERAEGMARAANESLAAGRKVLLIVGVTHLVRLPDRPEPDVIDLIDRENPGATYVALTHAGFDPGTPETNEREQRLSSLPKPSLFDLDGSWVGELKGCELTVMFACDSKVKVLADGYLYLSSAQALSLSVPSPLMYRDDAYFRELKRRWQIAWNEPLSGHSEMFEIDARWYPAEAPSGGGDVPEN
jgi:hypothetical protein